MKQQSASHLRPHIPKDAVLLIPEPERAGEKPIYGIRPGYYDKAQLLELLETHQDDADAIHFLADMLETGEAENDGFVELLRKNCGNSSAIASIIKNCRLDQN
jgi:hypothetical protein